MDKYSDAEITAEIRYPDRDLDEYRVTVPATQKFTERIYPRVTLKAMPKEVWTAIVAVTIFPLLLVLLLAIHPWTFAGGTAGTVGSGQPDASQFGEFAAPTADTVVQENTDTDADTDSSTDEATSSSAAPDPASEAAAVTSVLQQAQAIRQSVVSAVQDASTCGDLSGDQQALRDAQSARESLATSAGDTPTDALPEAAEVPAELSTALTDSATADGEFADWVADLESSCDKSTATDDSNYQQAESDSKQASADKQTVLATWNSVASQYGQPTFTESDI